MGERTSENKAEFRIPVSPWYCAIVARHTVTVPGEYGDTHAKISETGIEPIKRLATRVFFLLKYGGLQPAPTYSSTELEHPPLALAQTTMDTINEGLISKRDYKPEIVTSDSLMTVKEAEALFNNGQGYKTIVLFLESDRDRVKASRSIARDEIERLMQQYMPEKIRKRIYLDSPRQLGDLSSRDTLDFVKYLGVEDSQQLLPGWLYLRQNSGVERLAQMRGCQTPSMLDFNIDRLRTYHFEEFLPLMKKGLRLFVFLYTHETQLKAISKNNNPVGFSCAAITSVSPSRGFLKISKSFIDTPLLNR